MCQTGSWVGLNCQQMDKTFWNFKDPLSEHFGSKNRLLIWKVQSCIYFLFCFINDRTTLIVKMPRYVPIGADLVQLLPNLTTLHRLSSISAATSLTWLLDRGVRNRPELGQIGPKWDMSGTFSDQISGSLSQNVVRSDLKQSRICPIWGQSDTFEENFDIRAEIMAESH